MKKLLITIICMPMIIFGQSVYTKDNMLIGDRQQFINTCAKSGDKVISINGIDIEMKDYCSCACDKLIPELYSWEMIDAYENNAIMDLFTKEKNLKILLDCANSHINIHDNFKFGQKSFEEYTDSEISIAVKSCVFETERDSELTDLFTYNQRKSYCRCAIEKLIREGFTFGQLKMIEDENSEVFNEITLPCVENILIESEKNKGFFNEYIPEDISGDKYMSEIKLSNYLGTGYKIKINVDGVVKYFLFDTGATDLIIDGKMERELIFNGSITKEDYVGEQEFILADNSEVIARVIKLNNIKIGDYVVDNVIVSVIDGGSLLCGLGLLNKFRKWDFVKESEILNIYK